MAAVKHERKLEKTPERRLGKISGTQTNAGPSLLIVDDEQTVRASMVTALQPLFPKIREAENGHEALAKIGREPADIVLLDVRLPDLDGAQVLRHIRERHPQTRIIMITDFPSAQGAKKSIQLGALDYLEKPFSGEQLKQVIQKAVAGVNKAEGAGVAEETKRTNVLDKIIGRSPPIEKLKQSIERVAGTESTVLLSGESGTGKDLVARAVHELSPRARFDFIPVDCSVLVESLLESELFGYVKGAYTGADGNKAGLFEIANHGTFFFDEISNLSYPIQSKLLRVIQERTFRKVGGRQTQEVDIRIISASNQNLLKAVERGTFRNDLYYRLNVIPLHIPPLREHSEDIPLLLDYFLKCHNSNLDRNCKGFSDEALEILAAYPWPGNVRELIHTVEQIMVLENVDVIRVENLPKTISQRRGDFDFSNESMSLETLEKRYIRFVLQKTRGIRWQAAKILGINRKTLAAKIKKYGLNE